MQRITENAHTFRMRHGLVSSVVVAVIRGHTRILSANSGRSQGIRRMLSAFTKKYN